MKVYLSSTLLAVFLQISNLATATLVAAERSAQKAQLSTTINAMTALPASAKPMTVMADVHGDYQTMITLLQAGKIIDEKLNWIAGDRIFVSLGDLLDRGPDSRKILDFFMQLEVQAEKAGGAFYMVLGNHEVMNIRGDLRYVSDAEYASFADIELAEKRQSVYQDFLDYSSLKDNAESKAKFTNLYPLGYFGLVQAYSPDGHYGRWLLSKDFILSQQNKLFAHGGFSPKLLATGLSEQQLNQQFRDELTQYATLWRELTEAGLFKYYFNKLDRHDVAQSLIDGKIRSRALNKRSIRKKAREFITLSDSLIFDSFGPTWYRGNMYCHEFSEELTVDHALNYFNANQIFLGHTPDKSRLVRSRFDGKVIMLDTGMLQSHYKGHPSLVQIDTAGLKVLNLHDSANTQPTPDPVRKPLYANDLGDAQLAPFYQKAKVVEEKTLGDFYTRPLRLTFELDGKQRRAIFKYLDTDPKLEDKRWKRIGNYADRFVYDIAAYKLDRLLGLNMVPFTMEYRYKNMKGILQYWIEDSVSKSELIQEKRKLSGFCSQKSSRDIMQIFDWLIHNEDRNTGNELYTEKNAQLWLIDHTRAFRVKNALFQNERFKPPTKISFSFQKALQALNREELNKALGDYLQSQQINSILKRRDNIIEYFDKG
ncbi:metallophosphoesterase [Kangiella sp. TOML190]|uniref:metallophosphoesterase n=1 Tax=Kangiella sp. TOML190 TaxID=2931351 RepID=UPI0020417094|nr:metallophosphoesterase [Kangiella sp. TOML190]